MYTLGTLEYTTALLPFDLYTFINRDILSHSSKYLAKTLLHINQTHVQTAPNCDVFF